MIMRQLIKPQLQTVAEKIRQRRRQMLVHSYLYYEKDTNIVSDMKWSKWAVELAELQNKHPDIAKKVEFAEQFEDWDGSSGAHLVYSDEIKATAERLLKIVSKLQKSEPKKRGLRRLI